MLCRALPHVTWTWKTALALGLTVGAVIAAIGAGVGVSLANNAAQSKTEGGGGGANRNRTTITTTPTVPTNSTPTVGHGSPSSNSPSQAPTTSHPSKNPSHAPTTSHPSRAPSRNPSVAPTTAHPSRNPSGAPTTSHPSRNPSGAPTISHPSATPSLAPSRSPSFTPSFSPSHFPTTGSPSVGPTWLPQQIIGLRTSPTGSQGTVSTSPSLATGSETTYVLTYPTTDDYSNHGSSVPLVSANGVFTQQVDKTVYYLVTGYSAFWRDATGTRVLAVEATTHDGVVYFPARVTVGAYANDGCGIGFATIMALKTSTDSFRIWAAQDSGGDLDIGACCCGIPCGFTSRLQVLALIHPVVTSFLADSYLIHVASTIIWDGEDAYATNTDSSNGVYLSGNLFYSPVDAWYIVTFHVGLEYDTGMRGITLDFASDGTATNTRNAGCSYPAGGTPDVCQWVTCSWIIKIPYVPTTAPVPTFTDYRLHTAFNLSQTSQATISSGNHTLCGGSSYARYAKSLHFLQIPSTSTVWTRQTDSGLSISYGTNTKLCFGNSPSPIMLSSQGQPTTLTYDSTSCSFKHSTSTTVSYTYNLMVHWGEDLTYSGMRAVWLEVTTSSDGTERHHMDMQKQDVSDAGLWQTITGTITLTTSSDYFIPWVYASNVVSASGNTALWGSAYFAIVAWNDT